MQAEGNERIRGTTGGSQGTVTDERGVRAESPRGGPRWGLKDWLLLPLAIAGVLYLPFLAWMVVGWWSIPAWVTLGVALWKLDPEEVVPAIMVVIFFGVGLSLPYIAWTIYGFPGVVLGLATWAVGWAAWSREKSSSKNQY